jgi:hypothetical protein
MRLISLLLLLLAAILAPIIQTISSRYSRLENLYEDRANELRDITERKRINAARVPLTRHVRARSLHTTHRPVRRIDGQGVKRPHDRAS